jgi:rhamnosyl/mannosyltransferase
MIRVLHVYKNYYPIIGGVANHIKVLCSEMLKDQDMNIKVLVVNQGIHSVDESYEGIRVIRAGRAFEFASTPFSPSLYYWMKRLDPDILHLHFPYPLGEFATLFFNNNTKVVLTYHSDIVKQKSLLFFYRPFLKKILKKANVIIASSPNYLSSSLVLKEFHDKVEIIPFGIDISFFQKRDEKKIREIREQFGSPLVLFVGMFRYYKGLQFLIDAAESIKAKFLLIGRGEFQKDLENQVRKKKLEAKIFFLGGVEDNELPAYYQASDIFVLPSTQRSEAFGIAQLEAMACGLPVISTELNTGTSFVNVNNVTGMVVPPAKTVCLASALNILLSDRSLRLRLGKTGKIRVEKYFSKELMTRKVKDLYLKILKQ